MSLRLVLTLVFTAVFGLANAHAQARAKESPLAATASPEFRAALRSSIYANYLAGRTASLQRDTEQASIYWRAALRQDPRNVEILERAFISSVTDGQLEEAFPLAERVIGIDKNHILARLVLATRAIRQNQFQNARTHLTGLPRAGEDLTANLLIGWINFGLNDIKGANESFDKLKGPEWYMLFKNYHTGLMLDAAGRRTDAGARFEQAYKTDPTVLRIVDAYGRWMSRAKGREEAAAIYRAYNKVIPDHPVVERALEELKTKALDPLVKTAPEGAAEVLYGLGAALARQGGEELALIYLRLSLYLEPNNAFTVLSLGDLFEFIKKPEQAVKAYALVAPTSPLKRNAEIQLGLNLEILGKTDEARKHFEALIAQRPNDMEAIQSLGNVLRARKNFTEAAEVYSRAIALIKEPEPQHWLLYYFRGIAYERSKNWPKAEADLKQALALVPESQKTGRAQVLNYLGYSWIDQGLNLEEGLNLVKKAVELRPDDGYIVDSLGWPITALAASMKPWPSWNAPWTCARKIPCSMTIWAMPITRPAASWKRPSSGTMPATSSRSRRISSKSSTS